VRSSTPSYRPDLSLLLTGLTAWGQTALNSLAPLCQVVTRGQRPEFMAAAIRRPNAPSMWRAPFAHSFPPDGSSSRESESGYNPKLWIEFEERSAAYPPVC
jgi:hypothetical protein